MEDKKIFWLILIFITYMHFEGFFKLFFNYHPLIHGLKYIFAILFFIIMITSIKTKKTDISIPILLFVFFVLIQFLNPLMLQGKGLILSAIGMFLYIAFIPLYFISIQILNKDRIEKILLLIIILASISATFAHIQYTIGLDKQLDYLPYSEQSKARISGLAWHGPIAFDTFPPASWYILGMLSCGYFISIKKEKVAYLFLLIHLSFALFTSGARTGILGVIISISIILAFYVLTKNDLKKITRIGFILLILLAASFQFLDELHKARYIQITNPFSAYLESRGWTWLVLMTNTEEYPLGIGMRGAGLIDQAKFGVQPVTNWMGDNYILVVTGELGIFGLLSLIILFYFIIKISFNNIINKKDNFLDIILLSLLIPMMAISILSNPASWFFWIATGYLIQNKKEFEGENLNIQTNKTSIIIESTILKRIILNDNHKKIFIWIENILKGSIITKSIFFINNSFKNSNAYKVLNNLL